MWARWKQEWAYGDFLDLSNLVVQCGSRQPFLEALKHWLLLLWDTTQIFYNLMTEENFYFCSTDAHQTVVSLQPKSGSEHRSLRDRAQVSRCVFAFYLCLQLLSGLWWPTSAYLGHETMRLPLKSPASFYPIRPESHGSLQLSMRRLGCSHLPLCLISAAASQGRTAVVRPSPQHLIPS